MMKKVYFGLIMAGFIVLVVTCVMLAKDGIEGGVGNCIFGYLGAFGCLYLALRGIDWIVEDQAREKRSKRR